MPAQDAAPVSGVFPAGAHFRLLEIRVQAIQLLAISRGSRNAPSHTAGHGRYFPGMLLSPPVSRPGKPSDPGTSLRVPPGYAGDITERLAAQSRYVSRPSRGTRSPKSWESRQPWARGGMRSFVMRRLRSLQDVRNALNGCGPVAQLVSAGLNECCDLPSGRAGQHDVQTGCADPGGPVM